jgi:uncharacterized protein (DUF58 family)
MRYRGPDSPLSKLDYAKTAAAALAYLILQQQDSVGLVTFDRKVNTLLRASSNPAHLKQILHVLEQSPAQHETSLGPILHDLAERLKKRGVVILLSDLFDEIPSLLAGLKHFRHRRHEVVVLHVLDAAEIDFPFQRTTLFRGLEIPQEMLTDPRALRTAYQAEINAFLKSVRRGCRDLSIDYVLVRTDQPLDVVLSSYLASRLTRTR